MTPRRGKTFRVDLAVGIGYGQGRFLRFERLFAWHRAEGSELGRALAKIRRRIQQERAQKPCSTAETETLRAEARLSFAKILSATGTEPFFHTTAKAGSRHLDENPSPGVRNSPWAKNVPACDVQCYGWSVFDEPLNARGRWAKALIPAATQSSVAYVLPRHHQEVSERVLVRFRRWSFFSFRFW
jgi:hypothetical protein